ncbi:YczE/YyaS/YitT family protein [Laceyella putida]|uniref:YitT family protein n=2 Tax=Laceyella putida TaxID=110101 RepID=A0ABW2RNF7_9BACL
MDKPLTRSCSYICGLIIKSLGISMILRSELGADAWNGFFVAMSEWFGFTVGSWVITCGVLITLLNAHLLKRGPNFLSLLTIFILGFCIDFWLSVLDFHPTQLLWKVLTFWGGFLLATTGISIYVQSKYALTPADHLMYILTQRYAISLTASKTVIDGSVLLLALLMQGPLGLGTVIYTFLCGPIIQFFIPKVERLLFTHIRTRS